MIGSGFAEACGELWMKSILFWLSLIIVVLMAVSFMAGVYFERRSPSRLEFRLNFPTPSTAETKAILEEVHGL